MGNVFERPLSMKMSGRDTGKRTLILLSMIVLLVSTASATDILREDVRLDLADSRFDVTVDVGDLTSNAFTYITTVDITSVNASIEDEQADCSIREVALGSEIRCDTDLRENFTVDMSYQSESLVENRGQRRVFRFQHPVYRPTNSYNLEVLLPEGSALAQDDDNTSQIISPLGAQTSTDGRQISVSWENDPDLGETLSFYILYEDFTPSDTGEPEDYRVVVLMLVGLGIVGGLAFVVNRRLRRESLSGLLQDLSDEEIEVMEIIMENDGEHLQKDVVDELDYSKAKVSGIVSDLVEKEYLKKTKEGRSNKLVIPRRYSY